MAGRIYGVTSGCGFWLVQWTRAARRARHALCYWGFRLWYREQDLNLYALRHWVLGSTVILSQVRRPADKGVTGGCKGADGQGANEEGQEALNQ